ncbi:hypothetical protein BOSE62_130244 [Bosea sp. 62]|nr:hypothetical protein BOSE7B_120247 [Bosea sp. 7B]CAD5278964.1 hypothetical protein BOSE21B_30669 [Bosea sp. 21B]CAD5280077.1 hypothetical protein BOSE46_40308 [Bosea sp. 46]VVT59593.1 hypothetical protein BOS5A_210384 [Bosea sp. EC-HK365B]VXB35329.1 hypothetical protein BOSE62_130244 [Bosea sp. 62]VXB97223.1 hypothetical protein BOSE127_160278 [Bosea sp. 127]
MRLVLHGVLLAVERAILRRPEALGIRSLSIPAGTSAASNSQRMQALACHGLRNARSRR